MPTSVPNFNFLALIVSEIAKEGVPKFNVGQTACQISASYLYASCSYANMYFP